jgi:hypothetical protein
MERETFRCDYFKDAEIVPKIIKVEPVYSKGHFKERSSSE